MPSGSAFSSAPATFLLPPVPPHPEGLKPANAEQEIEAPVAPGGKRLKLLDWGTYFQYFRRPVLGGLLIDFFLFTFAFATFTAGFALFAERRFVWGPKEVGYVFMYSGFLGIIVQGAMRQGALVKRLGEVRLVTLGFLCAALGYVLLGLSFGLALLLVAASFSSFGTGVLRPALLDRADRRPGHRRLPHRSGPPHPLGAVGRADHGRRPGPQLPRPRSQARSPGRSLIRFGLGVTPAPPTVGGRSSDMQKSPAALALMTLVGRDF
ncbi:MAG: MFS transporter [Deltaproteobacteria bacterium]|nr:MAG: MFS transporter [Deltaproteobacteria bacterium]